MLAADSVCAMTPKFQMGTWYKPTTEKEWIRSEFPSWIFLIFHLYLSKSPHTIWGSVAPLPCEVLSAQDLVPPLGEYLNYRWKKFQLGGYKVKQPAPIYAGVRRYKVLSAQDLTREGGYRPPYGVRWFA